MPVNFPVPDIKPTNCLSTLTTIPEAISSEPSCSNLHDLSKGNVIEKESWCIYENDQENAKSTDALLDKNGQDEDVEQTGFPISLSFTVVKENPYKSNLSSNCSVSKVSLEAIEKPTIIRSRSGSKNASKIYDPVSSESLSSQGYVDDFDESCALINNDCAKKRNLSSNDLIIKRNSLGVIKAPQIHRFSAGDADKLEKGIKTLPSTRSLRDS